MSPYGNSGAGPIVAHARMKPTVLIVEDDADVVELLKTFFDWQGYDIAVAEDGVKAVELALTKFPDLALVDLGLPRFNGFQVIRTLRRHPRLKDVPIVVISGYDPDYGHRPARDAGCTDYLVKPIDFRQLEDVLKTNIKLRKQSTR